jgi:hypothetical protein
MVAVDLPTTKFELTIPSFSAFNTWSSLFWLPVQEENTAQTRNIAILKIDFRQNLDKTDIMQLILEKYRGGLCY